MTKDGRGLRQPALVNGALTGFDPARIGEYLDAFRELTTAVALSWPDDDRNLMLYPMDEMERAIELLDPIYGKEDA
jgi:hypothetical protein